MGTTWKYITRKCWGPAIKEDKHTYSFYTSKWNGTVMTQGIYDALREEEAKSAMND